MPHARQPTRAAGAQECKLIDKKFVSADVDTTFAKFKGVGEKNRTVRPHAPPPPRLPSTSSGSSIGSYLRSPPRAVWPPLALLTMPERCLRMPRATQMWFDDFQKSLDAIATKKGCSVEKVRAAIISTGGPSTMPKK